MPAYDDPADSIDRDPEPSSAPSARKESAIALPVKWSGIIDVLDFAFQPIVNPLTGVAFAVEALLRNHRVAGFDGISDVFDAAYDEKALYAVDIELRKKAVKKFRSIAAHRRMKLFYNYDPRVHNMPDYSQGITETIMKDESLSTNAICFELSEKHKVDSHGPFRDFLSRSRKRGIKIALDDFGAGFAGLELFYHTDPDFLKFDRFLICGIDSDIRKRTFCTHIISLAKLLGVVVIAEGIETEREFLTCKDLGFDLTQGYFIQKPVTDTGEINGVYKHIKAYEENNRRKKSSNAQLVLKEMACIDTINTGDGMEVLFSRFNRNSQNSFFPVLDTGGFPVGIIHERSIKKYIYSPFGYDLLHNKSLTASLHTFIEKCPIVDMHTSQEKILEIFASNPDIEGVIITEDLTYAGFLTAKSLLNILHEINLMAAREMNPLSGLPGNTLINRYITDALNITDSFMMLAYFDFNHFKPFNDRFGFRQGDRAILLFAEMLAKEFSGSNDFKGHIGGDDFFAGVRHNEGAIDKPIARFHGLVDRFNDGAASFYGPEEVQRGFYRASDRGGTEREFPLITVSAAIIIIPPGDHRALQDEIGPTLSDLKNKGKRSGRKIEILHLK